MNYEPVTTSPQQTAEFLAKHKLRLVPVAAITTEPPQPVFDIEVPGVGTDLPNSFVANNVVVHNSTSPEYIEAILKTNGIKSNVEKIFGVRDNSGKWVVRPRVRYYSESIAERFFDYVASLERVLPDKIKVGDQWYYIWENTKANQSVLSGKYDKEFFSKTNKFKIQATDSNPQALIIVDSYPAMLPESQDVEDPSHGMAMQARMFSEQTKRIRGKLRNKRISIVGVNQLRLKPAVMYGCLHGDVQIPLVDGRSFSIREIVEQTIEGQVWSYNTHACELEPQDIVGWHNNGKVAGAEDWLTIRASSPEPVGYSQVTVTLDHKIFTARGWLPSRDLVVGDRILSKTSAKRCDYFPVLEIHHGKSSTLTNFGKFDISVRVNSNYLAGSRDNGVLVHNSPQYEPCGESLKFSCMSEDTLVFTNQGVLYANDVAHRKLPTVVCSIVGEETPTVFAPMGYSQIVEVSLAKGFFVRGKPDHLVLALGGGGFVPRWCSLQSLSGESNQEKYVAVKYGSNVWSDTDADFSDYASDFVVHDNTMVKCTMPTNMDENLAELLGYLVGDGNAVTPNMGFVSGELDVVHRVCDLLETVFGLESPKLKESVRKHENTYRLQFYSVLIHDFLCHIGCGGKAGSDKTVPWSVMQSTSSCVSLFVAALFTCDGSVNELEIRFYTVSRQMATEVHLLLLNFGVISSLKSELKDGYGNQGKRSYLSTIYTLRVSGSMRLEYVRCIGFLSEKQSVHSNPTNFSAKNQSYNILPKLVGWDKPRRGGKSFKEYVASARDGNATFFLSDFDDDFFAQGKSICANLRTEQEREAFAADLKGLKKFVEVTRDHKLIWLPVQSVSCATTRAMTYDFNMPETSTIVTNGIVSHNSDVRLCLTPRANPHAKGQFEEEEGIDGGTDTYRYIHVRAAKNKLSTPYLEGMMRVWVSDAGGQAHGMDPVYDTYNYLHVTGQISGPKNKLKLAMGEMTSSRSLSWLDFKKLVLGSKEVVREVCTSFDMPLRSLRSMCTKQLASGVGVGLFFEHKKVSKSSTPPVE